MTRKKGLSEANCFEAINSSTFSVPATFLIRGDSVRDPQSQGARLAHHFLEQNRGILSNFAVQSDIHYDGRAVQLRFQTGTQIGAFPLLSPTTSKPDYGLVIKPRFGWSGIGPLLAQMGWRVLPSPLKLPLLRQSERKVPPWVLSSVILHRIKALLGQVDRTFDYVERCTGS
ncbi:hypothetical protein [Heliorestis convoluta]|uniref:Uncharacterized protein n=1 Tax=Heliorestis convoluta TaxID=356322 RepID=A0A5Q2N2H0_9FIRM|nr:hypothetical protein [Heliorestis convoluta]QGG48059.1 hypothetical protein FTV88_1961 [Heliorestis convoluta]